MNGLAARSSFPAPKVSVLMPAHNEQSYCAQAIESILGQTFGDFEFLIVNDGSTDGTAAIIDDYASRDPRIRVFHQVENQGISASLNRGLAHSRADLIARMDADDIAFHHRLSLQVAFMREHADIVAAGSSYCHVDAEGNDLNRISHRETDVARLREMLVTGSAFAHPTMIMRRGAVIEAGGYRSAFDLAEDYDLWLRLSERADMTNIPDILMQRRLHPGNVHEYAGARQGFLTDIARLAARCRRRGQADPFDSTSAYDDRTMVERLALMPDERVELELKYPELQPISANAVVEASLMRKMI